MFDPNRKKFGQNFGFGASRMERDTIIKIHTEEKQTIMAQVVRNGQERSLLTTRIGIEHLKAPAACSLPTINSTHKKLFIDDSKQKIHHGRYMVVRTIVDPFKMLALHTVVEDERGGVLRLCLYNFVSPLFVHEDVSWALPRGQKLVLLEPCVKPSVSGITVLRCDNPSHLALLDDGHPFLRDVTWMPDSAGMRMGVGTTAAAAQCKTRGNELFRRGAYCEAASSYSKSLDNLSGVPDDAPTAAADALEMKMTVLSNRSETMLKLGQHHLALRDASAALALNAHHGKSLLRKVRALVGVRLFSEAREAVLAGLKVFKEGDVLAELSAYKRQLDLRLSAPTRMREADIDELLDSCDWQHNDSARLLWPDFSRDLRVKRSQFAHGRGTFAAEAILQGDVVLVEKAICVVYPNEVKKVVEQPVLFSGIMSSSYFNAGENKTLLDAEKMELIYRMAVLSSHLPAVHKALGDLSGLPGSEARGVGRETAGCTNTIPLPVCIEAIETICSRNALRPDNVHTVKQSLCDPEPTKPPKSGESKKWSPLDAKSIGMWRKAGLINHRCTPNCSQLLIGDILILVALHDIRPDEELSINYAPICDSYSQRQLTIERFGFKCVCRRCRREEAHRVKYDRSVEKFFALEKAFAGLNSDLGTLLTSTLGLQKAVTSITPGRKESLLLASISDLLVRICTKRRKVQESTKAALLLLKPLQCSDHDLHLLPVYQAVLYLLRACQALNAASQHATCVAHGRSELQRTARDCGHRGLQLAKLMLGHSSELVKFVYGQDVFSRLQAACAVERNEVQSEVD